MTPLISATFLLLCLTIALTLAGMAMLGNGALKRRATSRFCRVSTLLVVAVAYVLSRSAWVGLSLNGPDLAVLLVVLALLSHATIASGIALQIKRVRMRPGFEDLLQL